MNVRSITTLRASHEAGVSSQVLQPSGSRMIRKKSWPEVGELRRVWRRCSWFPPRARSELTDAHLVETMKVYAPQTGISGLEVSPNSFTIQRAGRTAQTIQAGDFTGEPTLFFEGSIAWRDRAGPHQRVLRSIICRAGLTRAGLYGSVLGRPGTNSR